MVTVTPELAYALPGRVSLRLRAPIHWKSFEEASAGSRVEKQGLGDLELVAGYDLVRSGPLAGARWDLAATAGMALPTGETETQPFVGQAAPTPLQLGGGTWDPLLGLAARHRLRPGLSVDATGAARLALSENSKDYRPPSVFEGGVGAAWRPGSAPVRLALHAEWSHVSHVEVAGEKVPNTGRDALYAVPAASLSLGDRWSFSVTGRVPLYLRVNETQLAEDALAMVRVGYRSGPLFGRGS